MTIVNGIAIAAQLGMRANLSVAVTKLPEAYQWSDSWDGALLAAFWVGYTLGNVPMSSLAARFGARNVLAAALVMTAIVNAAVTLVFPWPGAIVALRLLSGIVQAPTMPCCFQIISLWCLPTEFTLAVSTTSVLGVFGNAGAAFLGNYFIDNVKDIPSVPNLALHLIFWVWSPFALMAAALLLYAMPNRHHRPHASGETAEPTAAPKAPKPPWRIFATSPALIACYVNHSALAFVSYTIILEVPLFMKKVLKAPPTLTSLTDSLPLLVTLVSVYAFSIPADMLIAKGFDPIRVRKTFQGLSIIVPALLLPLVSLGDYWALVVFMLVAAFNTASNAGVYSAYLDVCPRWSGQIYSMGNTICAVAAATTPLIVQAVVSSTHSQAEGYKIAFWLFGCGFGFPAFAAFAILYTPANIEKLRRRVERYEASEAEATKLLSISRAVLRDRVALTGGPCINARS